MEREKKIREQISALADGELEAERAKDWLDRANDPSFRAAWDRYHQIGDAIRSDDTAQPMSLDFAARMSARLDAEPPLLAPKRHPMAYLRAWPAALAIVAAGVVGFYIAPGLFGTHEPPGSNAMVQVIDAGRRTVGTVLPEAGGLVAIAKTGAVDYIRLHQSANPSLYNTAPLSRPLVLDDGSER